MSQVSPPAKVDVGAVAGVLTFPDGQPVAHTTVTVGLGGQTRAVDPAAYLKPDMHYVPDGSAPATPASGRGCRSTMRCDHGLVEVAERRFAEPNPVDARSVVWVKDEYVIVYDELDLAQSVMGQLCDGDARRIPAEAGTPTRRSSVAGLVGVPPLGGSGSAPQGIVAHWHLQAVADRETGNARDGWIFRGRFGTDLQVLLPGQEFAESKIARLPTLDYKLPPEQCFAMRHLMLTQRAPRFYLAVLRPLPRGRKPVQDRLLAGCICDLAQPDGLAADGCDRTTNGFVVASQAPRSAGQDAICHPGAPHMRKNADAHLLADGVGVRVTGEGIDGTLFFSRRGRLFQEGDVRFKGQYAAVLRRAGRMELVLPVGGELRVGRCRFSSSGPAARLCAGLPA